MTPEPVTELTMPPTAAHHPVARVWCQLRAHAPLLLILAVFAVFAATYGVTMPLGETPDELAHYRYVRYIDAAGHPPRTAEERAASGYKGHEPPLYYLFVHRATAWLRVSERPMLKLLDPDLAPRHTIGAGTLLWNAVLHTADESFPWSGTSLAWHVMRLLSIPLGMVTILGVYRIGRFLAPGRPTIALLAAGLTALTPQFVYLGGALNNDNLAVPLSVLTLAALVAIATGNLRWRQFLLLGLLAGLARVTKFHTLVLLPVIVVALIVVAWRRRCWARCALGGALALGIIVLVSAPWILAVEPDNPGADGTSLAAAFLGLSDTMHAESLAADGSSGDPRGLFARVLDVLRLEPLRWALTLFQSYWAFFGQMTVAVGRGIYLALAALCLAGVLGVLRLAAIRRRAAAPVAGMAVLALAGLAYLGVELVFYALMRRLPDTAQGRHLYPAFPAWSLLLAVGLLAWAPPRHAGHAVAGLLAAMAGLCLYLLPAYALPAYEPALPVRTALPASWHPEVAGAGEPAPGIAYLGCGPAEVRAGKDRHGALTLLWQATGPLAEEYLLRVEYADAAGVWRLLSLSYPVGGRWPTRAWDPGDYVADRHALPLPSGLPAGRYPLRHSWVDVDGRPLGLPVSGCHLVVDAPGASGDLRPVARVRSGDPTTLRERDGLILTAAGAPDAIAGGLTSDRGEVWRPSATESHPAATGDLVRAFYLVGPRTPPGSYALPEGMGGLAEVHVATVGRRYDAPEDIVPSAWRFGDGITLIGYRLEGLDRSGTAMPGQTLGLVLAWRADAWVPRNYTVFTHLVAADGTLVAQHDGIPRDGYATLFWAPGEVVVDYHPLVLPADAPPGEYRVLVGLYTRPDGTRLSAVGAGGAEDTHALMATIQVLSEGND